MSLTCPNAFMKVMAFLKENQDSVRNFWASSFLMSPALPPPLVPTLVATPWATTFGDWTTSDHLLLFLFAKYLHCFKPLILLSSSDLWLSHHLFWFHFALHPARFPQLFINMQPLFSWKCPHLPQAFFSHLFFPAKISPPAKPYRLSLPVFTQLNLTAEEPYCGKKKKKRRRRRTIQLWLAS